MKTKKGTELVSRQGLGKRRGQGAGEKWGKQQSDREAGSLKLQKEERIIQEVWSEWELAAEAKAIKEVQSKKDRRFGDLEDRSGGC